MITTSAMAMLLVFFMALAGWIAFMAGQLIGRMQEQNKIVKYCEENDLNMTRELLRDVYPAFFWCDTKRIRR
ncbi:hypothetical protein [Mongoliibacter ruber]|uniref:Uncharacterized protein n=1 Tax=Mongoliibacter ruber TaxID=1750599 RepID=A0A2T0WVA2_9BACT|nr:hypothetical protein [Mongoliibacter ruber]PRY90618.1 hypothetical protein CLW00_101282 [Mongoliibacter ruber]